MRSRSFRISHAQSECHPLSVRPTSNGEASALARAKGIKLMMGEMVESELASCAAAQFAAGLGGFDFIDLDTPFFIKDSGLRRPAFLSSDGVYSLSRVKAGVGVEPR